MLVVAWGALAGCSGPARFDLQCHVREMDWDHGAPGLSKDYNVEYRIDLIRKKWCADECENWTRLRVDGRALTTWDTDMDGQGHDSVMVHQRIHQTIDRETGKLTSVVYMRVKPGPFDQSQDKVMTIEGDCVRGPFIPSAAR